MRASYAGVFLIAQATLMLEILLTRITSVTAWYHLAFFVISLAMLGMTGGAIAVFLAPGLFPDELVKRRIAQSTLVFALAIPISVALALSVPLMPVDDTMGFASLILIGGLFALPFLAGGVALTLALTRAGLPPSLVYGVDLCGAASGCIVIIPLLDTIDAASAAIVAAAVAALAAAMFCRAAQRPMRWSVAVAITLGALAYANAQAPIAPLRPAWVKGIREDPRAFMFSRWNTYSRVTVDHEATFPPSFWAKGRNTPFESFPLIAQRFIRIDGAAGTIMAKLGASADDHAYLDWDVTSFAHHLRPHGRAAVIGVGGGRDVLAAVHAGHESVVGVELNDIIVDLHRHTMADFAGLSRLPGVELVNDEARSYFARDTRKYSVIAMSLIDTWASTGAGAYSLSENGLYTAEAWQTFLERLEPNGIFTVSRWYVVNSPGETARMLALALETAWRMGSFSPNLHVALVQNEIVATLLLSPKPFSDADVDRIEQVAVERGFNMIATPRKEPVHPLLKELWRCYSREALWHWASSQKLDLTPPTDSRPFFFNMLKPMTWFTDRASVDAMDLTFLGNLKATQTLLLATLASVLLTLATLIAPMWRRRGDLGRLPRKDVAAALGYFALIGLGFMFVEIGLLSRLSVFLGHPTLALAVLLAGIILFAGVGSMLSARVPLENLRWARLYPLIPALLVCVTGLTMLPLMHAFAAAGTATRIAVSVGLMVAPALALGLCFPLGLRLSEAMEARHGDARVTLGPWLWGINGAFGVCASGLALGCSMVFGIQTTLFAGAACYLLLPLCTWRLTRA